MDAKVLEVLFKTAQQWAMMQNTWTRLGAEQAMVDTRACLRWFGLNWHKCPVCWSRMRYYQVMCRARNEAGELVGKRYPFPVATSNGFLSGSGGLLVFGGVEFGICVHGHRTSRIYVNNGGGDGVFGYLIYHHRQNTMLQVGRP